MKIGKIIGLTIVIDLMFLIIAPCATAQHLLSDVWFKMKIVTKGYTISPPDSAIAPYRNTSTVYVRF